MNEDIRPLFKPECHWSGTEFDATIAWIQGFTGGGQLANTKDSNYYVRAVKRVKI